MARPAQRTLKAIREKGYRAGIVERWLRYAGSFGKRQDLYGIIDILAITPDETLGIQACGAGGVAEHYRKLTEGECAKATLDWLSKPGRTLQIWCWRKVRRKSKAKKKVSKKKKKIKKKKMSMTWKPRIVNITLEDLKNESII